MNPVATPTDLQPVKCKACGGSGHPLKVIGKGPDGRPDWVAKYPEPEEHARGFFGRVCLWCDGVGTYGPARDAEFRKLTSQAMLVEVDE